MAQSRIVAMILAVTMVFTVLAAFPMTSGAASVSDADFFAKLNYSAYPGLSAVKAAVDAGNYSTAKAELLKYFKERHNNGSIKGFGISNADEFYGMAVLPMRNILTGPYEFDVWQAEFTVTSSDFKAYKVDITDRVMQELGNGAVSFMLFAGDKQQYPVLVKSKEAGADVAPKLNVTYEKNGVQNTAVIVADNDTYISSKNTGSTYGAVTELYVKEDGTGSDSTGTHTRRTYINFPLAEVANSTILSAELVVNAAYAPDCNTGAKTVLVINVGDTKWSENSITWAGTRGNIYSYQNAEQPAWGASAPNADGEYHNVTSRFWFGKPMAYEYLSYLENPEAYNASHPYSDIYPGAEFGPKLVELMNAFAAQMGYGYTRTLETGERLNRWVDIVDAFLGTDVFDDHLDEFVNILSFMWGDCNWLNSKSITDGSSWWSNWRIVANAGFFKAVEFLPEFNTHDTWRAKVEGNVEYTLDLLYNDDMSFTEAGPSYNAWCVKLFGDCIKAANMSGRPMSDEFMAKVRYAARNALESYYPNGYDTNIGDSNYRDQMYYFEMLDGIFNGRDSIIHSYVTGSNDGAEYLSSYYPKVNSAYMRNTWEPDEAVYVNFTNNPNDGHYHPDSNQVIMYAYGQPLVVDSGRYSYSSTNSIYNELRYASAHNTVEAVGVSMGSHTNSATSGSMKYTSNNVFDFASDEQHGFPGVSHTRNVLYMRDGYAIVTDYVKGGNANQEYRQNWHFLPSNNATVSNENAFQDLLKMDNGPIAKTHFYNGANIVIASSGADNANILGGYHSADYGLVANSEYASFSKTGATVKFDTLLYPTRAGEEKTIALSDISDGDDNAKVQILDESGKLGGYYYVNNTGAAKGGVADYVTDAKMLMAFGNYLGMTDGTYIKSDYGTMIASPSKIDSIVITYDSADKVLYVDGENLAPAKTDETAAKIDYYKNAVEKVVLNGEEIELKTDADGNIISVASTNAVGNGSVTVGGVSYNIVSENLIHNAGFETGKDGWTSHNSGVKALGSNWSVSTERAHEGQQSLKVTQTGGWTGANNDNNLQTYFDVENGKTYYLKFYEYWNSSVASSNSGHMTAAVASDGYGTGNFKPTYGGWSSWQPVGDRTYARNGGQWVEQSFVIDLSKASLADPKIVVAYSFNGFDGMYLDDFSLVEIEPVKSIYDEPTTVAVVSALRADGAVVDAITGASVEVQAGSYYKATPEETINHNGKTYVLNKADSLLVIKVADGKNIITAYYDETFDSPVRVSYVDEDGAPIKEATELLVPFGESLDETTVPFEKTVMTNNKAYIFKEAYGLGAVSDGEDKEVVLVYEAFEIETKAVKAVKSTTVAGDKGTYTNYSSENTERIMMDNRSNSGKNRFSIIDIGEISADVVKVTMLLKELEAGGDYSGTYSAYDASNIGTSWTPAGISNVSISGTPVASASASGNTITFDLTEGVKNGIRVYALRKNSDGYVIMGGTTTSVAPVISVSAIKDKVISSIAAPEAIEIPYAGTVTIPQTLKAVVEGKEKELDVISVSGGDIDTRVPQTTEVSLKVAVPAHYALGSTVSDTVKFNVTVLPESEPSELAPYGSDSVSAVVGQVEAGVHKFGGKVTRKANFDFDLTINTVSNTLVAINNSANMTANNYFAGSSVFMLINNGKLFVRNGANNGDGISVAAGDKLHVSVSTDVEAGVYDAVITNANGDVVYTAEGYGYRTLTDALDCLVSVDNSGVNETVIIENFKVTTSSFYPEVGIYTEPELRLLEEGLGLAFTAKLSVNLNLVEKVGFEYGAYKKDSSGCYVVEDEDLSVEFEQISTDLYRLVIKGISIANSVRLYGAVPYVEIGGDKVYGAACAKSLYSALVDSIVDGQGKMISKYYIDSANKVIAAVGYRNASDVKFPGQAAAEDKIFNADGTLKQEYADMGLSLDNANSEAAEFMTFEEVEIEFVEDTTESETCSDISMELDFAQVM